MRKFVTFMVALTLVVAALVPAFSFVNADGDRIREGEPNTPATMAAVRWHKVGYDHEGNMLNPSTLDYTEVERAGLDGTGYRFFPWQDEGEQIWGRASDDIDYEMPRLLPTSGNHDWLGRFDASNYDFDYDNSANNYAWWTVLYLNIEPDSGNSQEYKKWYVVIDRDGNAWFDPDGKFHRCELDSSADPMYFEAGSLTYAEGTCRTNPKALLDPIPSNNTQGPYNLKFGSRAALDRIYFWWKYDSNGNLVDRVWRLGWTDMVDYDPAPNLEYGVWDPTDPDTWSVVSYVPTYDPYTKTHIPDADVDWDAKLDTVPFALSMDPVWPNVTEGIECYHDANGNGVYDPHEFIYRKGPGFPAGLFMSAVQPGDVRLTNVSTEDGIFKQNLRAGSIVGANEFDNGAVLLPFNHMNPPSGYPTYVHTHSRSGANGRFENGEFIYWKGAASTTFGNTWLELPAIPGSNIVAVASVNGFDLNDEVAIFDPLTGTYFTSTIDDIDTTVTPPLITLDNAVTFAFPLYSSFFEIGEVEIGDIRLTTVNERHNNNSRSWDWHGTWWTDALLLLEVLEGGCHTPLYNITVESNLWMGGYPTNGAFEKGDVPSESTAALHSPNGDLVAAAQRIQKTTVLDPTGFEFEVPATTFENIKLEYREYLGLEIFKDDGINNNVGEPQFTVNCVRGDIVDDYYMYDSTEEFVGADDVEAQLDFEWSRQTQPFSNLEMFVDVSGEGALGVGEPIYLDEDLSYTVSAGDLRITDVEVVRDNSNIIAYPAGSRVTAGDADVDFFSTFPAIGDPELSPMPAGVEYYDQAHGCVPPNDTYDIGEPIYYQAPSSGIANLYSNDFNNQNNPTGTPPSLTFHDNTGPGTALSYPAYSFTNTVDNWGELDETNSGLLVNGGVPTSVTDRDNNDPGGQIGNPAAGNFEVCFFDDNSPPVGATRCSELYSGTIILNPSLGMEDNKIFSADVFTEPNPASWWDWWPPAVIFRYDSPNSFYALKLVPYDGSYDFYDYSDSDGGFIDIFYAPAPPTYRVDIIRYAPADGGTGYTGTSIFQTELNSFDLNDWMNVEIRAYANLAGFLDYTDILIGGTLISGSLPSAINAAGSPPGGFGFMSGTYDGGWAQAVSPLYFDNVNLSTYVTGATLDTVRLTDVWINGTKYPAGSKVVAGDFYRLENPVYGVTTGKNTNARYMDIEVLPGDIGLKYEIDGFSPEDEEFKPLKIEKTSHVKVYLDHELEGVYATGKVIGDKRNRLYYRPDSFYVNTIPAEYQVVYSSPGEAERNFFHPHTSIQGDKVYVSLRETDTNIPPYIPTSYRSEYIEEIIDTTAIIDAENPEYEFEFTPYRGTIVDDIGQELPILLRAYMDDGGIETSPDDSRFSYSFMLDKNLVDRTVDAGSNAYSEYNFIDPWHMQKKWEIDEAYANYWNQAYTRAARFVPSPYEVEHMAECGLSDNYDCYGVARLHVDPEGIEIIPSSPCVDPLSYRYPNISLKLKAYDNPDDINDPAGYTMTFPVTEPTAAIATYNVNGAGIRYMCTMRAWNMSHTVPDDFYYYFIVQVNDDGSWMGWRMNETVLTGIIDPTDSFSVFSSQTYPFLQKFNNRGNDAHDIGDYDCSVGKGVVDLCGSGWPPLGDVTLYDTYSSSFCDPTWTYPNIPYYGTVCHYGVRTLITPKTETDEGGLISVVCQPMNTEEDLHIRVHTSNVEVDYNSTNLKHGNNATYFRFDRSGIHQGSTGGTNPGEYYVPSVSNVHDTNPPGIRNLPMAETVDYCDVINLKVLPPDTDLNFNNLYIVDHALQYSDVEYVGSSTGGDPLVVLDTPERWIRPDYNPLCVLRPLSDDENTDVRCYPGGQTHLMRVENSLRGNGFNATPALWRKQFNKLGTEFYGLTDYGLYFELTREDSGYWGVPTTFVDGMIKRIEITGPFMTPLDLDPEFDSVKYRSGTATGSILGYQYKDLRYVPIKYDYSGKIVVDTLNYMTYELGPSDFSTITSPACTIPGDFITFSDYNMYLAVGKELDFRWVVRPQLSGIQSSQRVMVFDELIPTGPGRIDITVWLQDGTKKIFQDCCVKPPADGIDVAGIEIEGMPHFITVDEDNMLNLKLTEGYGIESVGPPAEYGAGIQEYKECNDALVYVWQDRGIYDPVERLYDFAGDGYCSMAPQSTDISEIYSPYTEDDDLDSDGKISFSHYETEIIGEYDISTNTWTNGLIDARTFHRQNGEYSFNVHTNTVGIDFGSYGTEAEPDHIIAPDETLDVTVTAYKYGDDNNDRSFRPFWGGRDTLTDFAFSHEVYLAGRASAFVEAREDLTATVIPEPLTAGCTPELLDPTAPLTFEVKWANGQPLNLRDEGVPDPKGGNEVKKNDAWMHLFKDPHPDDQYYYPGQMLPQYYWLRTDLHNDDWTQIGNQRMYGYDTDPFNPIEFSWNPKEGVYEFEGFVANDKGSFETVIYSPDRRHKATVNVSVELPKVSYELHPRQFTLRGYDNDSSFDPNLVFHVNESEDFVATGADLRYYATVFTFKNAQGKLIQGLAESTSVCQGGDGMYARFTPFFTRPEYYNWVSPPNTSLRYYRRYPQHTLAYNYYLGSDPNGGREEMIMIADLDGSGSAGDIWEEYLQFGYAYSNAGFRVGGDSGPFAPYYPTVNYMYEDGTYNHWQSWDGPYEAGYEYAEPAGYGVGCIYNEEYEKLYLFPDTNRDYTFDYQDSLNIDNRGQGLVFVLLDDKLKYGATVGVTKHALKPKFSDIYGGTDPYNEYSPQRTATRFVHVKQGNADYGTSDGVYALDWDAMPDRLVKADYVKAKAFWAETREEVGKEVLNENNYDLAYGVENHLWVEFTPADPRDNPVVQGLTVTIADADKEHPWGGSKSENVIFSTIIKGDVNPNVRAAQMYVTPTGTGAGIMALNKTGISDGFYFDHCTSYGVIKFDVIMSIQLVADSLEPLKVGVPGTLVVSALKTAGGEPIEGATIHIKGAGVEMEKKTNADGKAEFNITPTERGKILVTAEADEMKGTYTTAFVERYVAPPVLDLDPVNSVTGENSVTIKGRTNEGTRITVNGRPVNVEKDGSFSSVIKLQPGKNSIVVVASNESAQTITKILVIESRVSASDIILDPIGEYENVTEIRLRGHVEPGTIVKVKNVTVGEEVDAVVTNDVFVADIAVQPGNNDFEIVAIDMQTNKENTLSASTYIWTKTTVLLAKNSDVAVVDGTPQKITDAPIVRDGIVMVPIEAIAGIFGITPIAAGDAITFTWGSNTLIISANSASATLNGNQVDLTIPAIVEGGIMMVAARDIELLKPDNGTIEVMFEASGLNIVISRRK